MLRVAHGEGEGVVGVRTASMGYGKAAATRSRNAVAAALVGAVVIHTTASRLQSSTAANSKSWQALRRAGRYLKAMWTSSPGRCFSKRLGFTRAGRGS